MSNANDMAFPIDTDCGLPRHPGLTKREYFAAMAMQGLMSKHDGWCAADLASTCVYYADALLAELERTK